MAIRHFLQASLLGLLAAAGCRSAPPVVQQTAPETVGTRPGVDAADVRFMQHMLAHHAQALVMTDLVAGRSTSDVLPLLAERIEVSQRDELALMRGWLARQGAAAPPVDTTYPPAHAPSAPHAHGDGAAPVAEMQMPGMLTRAQLDALAATRGLAFDRLFLQSMILHHEGALAMVADYLATPGAAQQTEAFQLASDIAADQRAEIARMRTLLDALPAAPPSR